MTSLRQAYQQAARHAQWSILRHPQEPQAAMFHLHIDRDEEALIQAITDYANATGVVVLPLPRARINHQCMCEISVGRRTMQQPPAFWLHHLSACLSY